MTPALRKILVNPHVLTSFASTLTVIITNVSSLPKEKVNLIVGAVVGFFTLIDAMLAGTADTSPGTETIVTHKSVEVDNPPADGKP